MELIFNKVVAIAVLVAVVIGVAMYLKAGTEEVMTGLTTDFENQITSAFSMQDDILND